jgi:hypothetical protein
MGKGVRPSGLSLGAKGKPMVPSLPIPGVLILKSESGKLMFTFKGSPWKETLLDLVAASVRMRCVREERMT